MTGSTISASRYHDFSCGHRVVGHEGKCVGLHGHNYRIYFDVVPAECLDKLGRVLDFSVIGSRLCQWLEDNWDHKMLLWDKDPVCELFTSHVAGPSAYLDRIMEVRQTINSSVQCVPFNPTAEEMARYLLHAVGPDQLDGTGTILSRVTVWETRKCYATASLQFAQPVTYEDEMSWGEIKDRWLQNSSKPESLTNSVVEVDGVVHLHTENLQEAARTKLPSQVSIADLAMPYDQLYPAARIILTHAGITFVLKDRNGPTGPDVVV